MDLIVCTRFIWLRIRYCGRLLWPQFHKRCGISWL